MKVATYNVWNENKAANIRKGNRFDQIIDEIVSVNADIIGLQEVTEAFYTDYLAGNSAYEHSIYKKYPDEDEGLAVLSKYPIDSHFFLNESPEYKNSAALNVLISVDGIKYSVTNVHLPWASALIKEEQIVAINTYIESQNGSADICILLGDFNCSYNSSIHRFLLGEQTIASNEAKPYWYELYSTYSILNDLPVMPTLDTQNNPRWNGENTIELPFTADRIYMKQQSKPGFKEKLLRADIFGTDVSPKTLLSASDHYGVYAQIKITG